MIQLRVFLFIFFAALVCTSTTAQNTHQLKTVNVNSQAILVKKTVLRQKSYFELDSSIMKYYQHKTLSDVLQENSNAFLKNYGIGMLSTISLRGSSAAQTGVYWNGINVNSATTGLSDFSLFPVSLFNKVSISSGEEGQIGGAIILSNDIQDRNTAAPIHLSLGYESTGSKSLLFSQASATRSWSVQNKLFVQHANNRFWFLNPAQDSIMPLNHARSQQYGLLSDVSKHIRKHQEVSLHVWLSRYYRQIPPTIYEDSSSKNDDGSTLRSVLEWKTQSRNLHYGVHVRTGYIRERYQYQDSMLQMKTQSFLQTIPFQFMLRRSKKNTYADIQWSANYANLMFKTDSNLFRTGPKLSFSIYSPHTGFNLRTFFQKEWSNLFRIPSTYGLFLSKRFKKNGLQLFVNAHTAVRTPTLNELYFNPGGNPNLKPEHSYNGELGINFEKYGKRFIVKTDLIGFKRTVQNWILWYGNAIFTPHNIAEVKSYGIDSRLEGSYLLKQRQVQRKEMDQAQDILLKTSFMYAYTISTTSKSSLNASYSEGKQLAYVPRYLFKSNVGVVTPRWEFSYHYQYTGYRFTTLDESEFLLPYTLHALKAGLHTNTYQYRIHWQLTLNNVLNTYYEGVWGRVMPGRNLGLSVSFEPILKNCCKRM